VEVGIVNERDPDDNGKGKPPRLPTPAQIALLQACEDLGSTHTKDIMRGTKWKANKINTTFQRMYNSTGIRDRGILLEVGLAKGWIKPRKRQDTP
jgi:hypothetical protein